MREYRQCLMCFRQLGTNCDCRACGQYQAFCEREKKVRDEQRKAEVDVEIEFKRRLKWQMKGKQQPTKQRRQQNSKQERRRHFELLSPESRERYEQARLEQIAKTKKSQLVDRRPEVAALVMRLKEAREQEAQAAAGLARSTAALKKWQQLHPAKAWLHRQRLWLDTSAQILSREIDSQRATMAVASAAQVTIASELAAERVKLLPAAEQEYQEMMDRQAMRTARRLDIVASFLQTGRITDVGNDLRQVLDSHSRLGQTEHQRIAAAAKRMVETPTLMVAAQKLLQPHQEVIAKVEREREIT